MQCMSAYYYKDEEVVVVASERPVIQTAFNCKSEDIYEIKRVTLIIKKNGSTEEKQVRKPLERKACSFERIYFSRGNDKDIYNERLELGKEFSPKVLKSIENDVKNTVFSYIPNTAEVSYFGLLKGCHKYLNEVKLEKLLHLETNLTTEK